MTAPLCTLVGLCVNGAMNGLMTIGYTWESCNPAQSRSSMITDVIWSSKYFAAKLRKRKSPRTYRASETCPSPEFLLHLRVCSFMTYSNYKYMQGWQTQARAYVCAWACANLNVQQRHIQLKVSRKTERVTQDDISAFVKPVAQAW